ERPRRHRRDGDRGADRPRVRSQRALAVRAAAGAGRRPDRDRGRRRPPAGHPARAALPGVRGLLADRHERRPGADGRRSHRRGRGRVPGPRDGARRAAAGSHRGDPGAADVALARPRSRGDPHLKPQAGRHPGGRRDPRTGRHGAWARRDAAGRRRPDRGRAAGPAARAAADVDRGAARQRAAARGAGGRGRVPARHAAPVRDPRVRDRGDAARRAGRGGRARAAGDHDVPAPRRGRGRHALRARRGPGLRRVRAARARAPCAHAVLRRRHDGRRAGVRPAARRRRAPGADDRRRRVVHGRAAERAPDRAPGFLGRRTRWPRRLLRRGKGQARGRRPGAHRARRRGLRGGRRRACRRGARGARRRRRRRHHGDRRAGRGHGREAGGPRLAGGQPRRRPPVDALGEPARQPRRHPRPLHDGRASPHPATAAGL
ncbi:MAG: ADP-ribose pyrophosphatase of COG1058 family / Nicotinamide-nucleotide amidase, partial [uncultured Solirubrobacteraceae bacterium]